MVYPKIRIEEKPFWGAPLGTCKRRILSNVFGFPRTQISRNALSGGGFQDFREFLRKTGWRARLGSNQQPLPSEGSTLSIELRALQHESAATRTDATPKRDRKDTRFQPHRPPGGPQGGIPSNALHLNDAGKRLLNTSPSPSPWPKACVYNRPWLI
jgi:hypothetical protein